MTTLWPSSHSMTSLLLKSKNGPLLIHVIYHPLPLPPLTLEKSISITNMYRNQRKYAIDSMVTVTKDIYLHPSPDEENVSLDKRIDQLNSLCRSALRRAGGGLDGSLFAPSAAPPVKKEPVNIPSVVKPMNGYQHLTASAQSTTRLRYMQSHTC
jgi:hypothetical protein